MKITVVIPTFNEEANILRAINSAKFANEIIVIDSYSTDNTIDIVKKTTAVIFQRKFDDFSSQKNYAIEKSSNNWIFLLDADEEINNSLKNEILNTIQQKNPKHGYSVIRDYYFMDKKIRYSGFKRNKVVRLIQKKYCRYNGNLVHERIQSKEKDSFGELKHKLNHWSYKSFKHHINKIHFYKQLQAKQLYLEGAKTNVFQIICKPYIRFVSHYFIKLGFLDGFVGFIIATLQAYGIFIKYVQLWLYTKNKN